MSDTFETANGIKKGSVVSPILFIIYMDELLNRLRNSGIGFHIGDKYYGGICYADDLDLLCPTANVLQKMVWICECFGQEYGVSYNSQNTVCVCISHWRETIHPVITLTEMPIEWVPRVKHLYYKVWFEGNWWDYNEKRGPHQSSEQHFSRFS